MTSLGPGGIFLSIDVAPGATKCSTPQAPVEGSESVSLAGVPTNLEAMAPGPGAYGAAWVVATSALVSGICYYLSFIAYDRHTRDATLPVAEAVVRSFSLLGG